MTGRPREYDEQAVARMLKAGMKQTEIAKRLGVSPRTIGRAARALGHPASHGFARPLTEDQHRTIRERLAEGWTCARIARTYGHAKTTIYRHYRELVK